jgi:acyl-CoA reductase-like NAD-dependent aldehyde dehydrogenase
MSGRGGGNGNGNGGDAGGMGGSGDGSAMGGHRDRGGRSGPRPRHLPVWRAGVPYRSLAVTTLRDVASGEEVAEVGQADAGLVGRDLGAAPRPELAELAELPLGERLAICRRAAALFAEGELAIGFDGETQSPDEYLRDVSATTGIPRSLARENREKLRATLDRMAEVVDGLTRGLPAAALDGDAGDGAAGSHFQRQADVLGAVLPSNSPGVHGLWLPAPALGVGLALKPGRDEPWTPLRLLAALAAAGCPRAALSFYPTDHAGGTEILLRCERSLLFGDAATVRPWRDDPRVQVHGPGVSKVILGEDQLERWPAHLDVIASSILANGGRSCINASGVWLAAGGRQGKSQDSAACDLPRVAGGAGGSGSASSASHGAAPAAVEAGTEDFGASPQGSQRTPTRPRPARELALALAERLAAVEALPLDDPRAELAAWPDPAAARRVSEWIDRRLAPGEAEDLTAAVRGGGRVAEVGGCTFLLPTLVWVRDPGHPLAHAELPFPFCAVVEAPRAELLAGIGPTLVATALTADEGLRRELLACRAIDHLHLGAVPTWQVSFAQPHEGNLFDLLYRRRALREAGLSLLGMEAAG